jgi:hypothetical protein
MFVNIKKNKENKIPEDFNWIYYRSSNLDLTNKINSYRDAVRHYKEHGVRQNRKYKEDINEKILKHSFIEKCKNEINIEHNVPNNFDWVYYKKMNPDINIINYDSAIKHYKDHGYKENRVYSQFDSPKSEYIPTINNDINLIELPIDFDWKIYKNYNKDLSFIKTEHESKKHYIEHGYKENRIYSNSNANVNANVNLEKLYLELNSLIEKENIIKNKRIEVENKYNEYLKKYIVNDILNNNIIENVIIKSENLNENANEITNEITNEIANEIANEIEIENENANEILSIDIPNEIPNKIISINIPNEIPNISNEIPNISNEILKVDSNEIDISNEISDMSNEIFDLSSNLIIHFIYGLDINETHSFEIYKYLSIVSAINIHNPKQVIFHYKNEPFGIYWDKLKEFNPNNFILKKIIEPKYPNKNIKHFSHKTDYLKLLILKEYGGLYLDIDTISINKLDITTCDLISIKHGNNFGILSCFLYINNNNDICIKILNEWINTYTNFKNNYWTYNSTILPLLIINRYINNKFIKIISNENYPLWYENIKTIKDPIFIHLWESWNIKTLREIIDPNIKISDIVRYLNLDI